MTETERKLREALTDFVTLTWWADENPTIQIRSKKRSGTEVRELINLRSAARAALALPSGPEEGTYAAGHRAGAEAMREAALSRLTGHLLTDTQMLRSLPLPAPGGEGGAKCRACGGSKQERICGMNNEEIVVPCSVCATSGSEETKP